MSLIKQMALIIMKHNKSLTFEEAKTVAIRTLKGRMMKGKL